MTASDAKRRRRQAEPLLPSRILRLLLAHMTVILMVAGLSAPVMAGAGPASMAASSAPLPLTPDQDTDRFVVSPDGKRIVYTVDRQNNAHELWTVEIAGRARLRLDPDLGANHGVRGEPWVSSDSETVIFTLIDARTPPFQYSVVSVPITGGDLTELIAGGGGFEVTPDEQWILFTDADGAVMRIPIGGGPRGKLSVNFPDGTGPGDFEVTPDSQHVLFTASEEDAVPGGSGLYSVPISGGQPVKLTPPLGEHESADEPTFTPDSAFAIYSVTYTDPDPDLAQTSRLFSSPVAGGAAVELSEGLPPLNIRFSALAAGNRVIFYGVLAADEDISTGVVSVPAAGGARKVISKPLGPNAGIEEVYISPDGETVVYARERPLSSGLVTFFSVASNGGPKTQLPGDAFKTFVPDSRDVIMITVGGGGGETWAIVGPDGIVVVDLPGGARDRCRLLDGWGRPCPMFTASGHHMLYTESGAGFQLHALPITGAAPIPLHEADGDWGVQDIVTVPFTDGVVFQSDDTVPLQTELYLVDTPPLLCNGKSATIVGTIGADVITGTEERDVIYAAGGDDSIAGRAGNDLICGGPGADAVEGGGGDDRLIGGPGNDTLKGGGGNDALLGGGGRDRLVGGNGDDLLKGGSGDDQASFAGLAAAVTADLITGSSSGQGSDSLVEIESLIGSSRADVLKGDHGSNDLIGRGGADRLIGRDGDDNLQGNGGDDELHGNLGEDTLRGGAGNDNLDGGQGSDTLRGGPGTDNCVNGENIVGCE